MVGPFDLAALGMFSEVNNRAVMHGTGEGCTYLGLLIRVPHWQSQLYPDAFRCPFRIELSSWERYQLAASNNNDTTGTQAVAEIQETVKFYSDTMTEKAIIPFEKIIDPELLLSLRETRSHDIISFLGRPVVLSEFLWSTTDLSNTVLAQYTNPSTLLVDPMYVDKTRGFVGFRGKMVIRVQVNAQRFQQGRLLIHYVPMYAHQTAARQLTALSNLVFKTQQPRVDFDIATDTEVELSIPFVYPFPFYPLNNSLPSLGTFFVSVYSPLISPTGDTNCDVVVWGHFEDIELAYPTVLSPQVGGSKRTNRTAADQELQSSGVGPISSFLGRVSKATTILSGIPLLSSVAGTASWASSIMAQAASAMGWSNPAQSGPANRMQNLRTPYMNNANAIDNSLNFGLFADNEVEVLPGFAGTDIDEMNLKHLFSIPSFIKAVTWTTAQNTGALLWSSNVGPNWAANQIAAPIAVGTLATLLPTPLCFFANFFQWWRGSICFNIKVVKTEFHSGRLVFTWTPGNTVDPLYANLAPVYKEVLDLRHSNEFSVCVPYASVAPWTSFGGSTGRVGLYVVNSLRGPSTVSTSVELLIEVNGGPDFEVSEPVQTTWLPTLGVFTPQVGGDIFIPQVLGDDAVSCGNAVSMPIADVIASSSVNTGFLAASKFCMGEHVVSMRQLLKRAMPFYNNGGTVGSVLRIQPWYIELSYSVSGSNPTYGQLGYDIFSVLGAVFAFSRGGIRLKHWTNGGQIVNYKARLERGATTPEVTAGSIQDQASFSNVIMATNVMTGAAELQIPQYTPGYMRVNRVGRSGLGTTPSPFNPNLALAFTDDSDPARPLQLYRQGSDDTDFGFFYGVVPMIPASGVVSPVFSW
jgi:hypothetical protein